jgi:hypothetical protein
MHPSSSNAIAQHTSVPAASLFNVISICALNTFLTIYGIRHTTVSVTNGVGVQLRGGCASEGPWFEKHRANLAEGPAIATEEFWIDRPNWRIGALESIFKICKSDL